MKTYSLTEKNPFIYRCLFRISWFSRNPSVYFSKAFQ